MVIFVVIRKRDNKVVGAYADTRAIFSLPSDVYTVCAAEKDKVTSCIDVNLTKDTSITLTPIEVVAGIPYVKLEPELTPVIETELLPTTTLKPELTPTIETELLSSTTLRSEIPVTIEISIESQTQ